MLHLYVVGRSSVIFSTLLSVDVNVLIAYCPSVGGVCDTYDLSCIFAGASQYIYYSACALSYVVLILYFYDT